MRILLVGEYSRLHNSLKEGLEKLGCEVVIIGNGDGFKKYPVDHYFDHSFKNILLHKLKVLVYKITSFDLGSLEIYLKLKSKKTVLKNFDVVQLINESPMKMTPNFEKHFIKFLKKNNKKLYLLSCGLDYVCVKYMMEGKFRYSILSAYLDDPSQNENLKPYLRYLKPEHKKLHKYIYKSINGVIASDMDYHIPLDGHPKYLGLIPNPINCDNIEFQPLVIQQKIKILHGINTKAVAKKGNQYFIDALKIIEQKYPDLVEITTTHDLPYKDYIKHLRHCHILLDQVLGYDQGYNALEAMAMGKVVLTGAEKEFETYYKLKAPVAINVLPEVSQIVNALSDLIEHPQKIITIGKAAREFIEKEHHYITSAKRYLETWQNN